MTTAEKLEGQSSYKTKKTKKSKKEAKQKLAGLTPRALSLALQKI